jgi:hypothetical protein
MQFPSSYLLLYTSTSRMNHIFHLVCVEPKLKVIQFIFKWLSVTFYFLCSINPSTAEYTCQLDPVFYTIHDDPHYRLQTFVHVHPPTLFSTQTYLVNKVLDLSYGSCDSHEMYLYCSKKKTKNFGMVLLLHRQEML